MLPVALVALVWAFANANGDRTTPVTVLDAKVKPAVPLGTWGDVASFPIVDLRFACVGQCEPIGPLYLKRAVAVGYPPNGKVYILGGRHRPDGTDIGSRWIWEYNPSSNTITQKNALLDQDFYGDRFVANMAVGVLTGTTGPRIYAVGGSSVDTIPSSSVRVYDPNTDTISVLPDPWPANPARIPGGYAVYNNKLYIFGGHVAKPTNQLFSDTWVFDPTMPQGQRWSQIPSATLSVPRAYIAGAQLDGYIYAIGGDQVTGNTATPLVVVERMDPTQGSPTWQPVASLPWPSGDMGAWAYDTGTGFEISGRIVVAGGGYPVPGSSALIYNPTSNNWSTFPSMLRPRRNYAAAQLNGILYAWGGYDVQGNVYNGSNTNMAYNASGPPPPPGITPTLTPSPVPTSCSATVNYTYTVSSGASIDPGNALVPGSHCQTCVVDLALPFPVQLYGRTFNSAVVGSNGVMQFGSDNPFWINRALPVAPFNHTLLPFWDDLDLTGTGAGVYTSVVGDVPNRTFNVEWRVTATSKFEVRLFEDSPAFEFIYGGGTGGTGTIGVQKDTTRFTQVAYNVSLPAAGTKYTWTTPPCGAGTPTPPPTSQPTSTATSTVTGTPPSPTEVPPSSTPGAPSATPACTIEFLDVPPGSTYYPYIHCLACHGYVNGYPPGYFRPNLSITRGQLSKIVSNAAGFTDPPGTQIFEDVPPGSLFYDFIQRLASRDVMTGYPCGAPNFPCVPPDNRPYFDPNNTASRGQTAKIVSNAAGFNDPPGAQIFEDIPPGSTFYDFIQRLASRGYINGYPCGGPFEPCVPPDNRPYYRPTNTVTRGQSAKIAANALVHDCDLP
jgi:hypothetical protein